MQQRRLLKFETPESQGHPTPQAQPTKLYKDKRSTLFFVHLEIVNTTAGSLETYTRTSVMYANPKPRRIARASFAPVLSISSSQIRILLVGSISIRSSILAPSSATDPLASPATLHACPHAATALREEAKVMTIGLGKLDEVHPERFGRLLHKLLEIDDTCQREIELGPLVTAFRNVSESCQPATHHYRPCPTF